MTTLVLPSKVYIGPYIYEVIQRDKEWYEDTEAYGSTWIDRKIINVAAVGDISSQLDTFLHECYHAMWSMFHMNKSVEEEEAVSKLSTAHILLIRQNPEILDIMYYVIANE